MSLKKRVEDQFKNALKSREELKVSTLRMLKAAIKNREIEQKKEVDDSEVVRLLSTLVKQRRESIEQYKQGGRTDLAQKEEKEILILEEYLPKPLGEEELLRIIEAAIQEVGASGPKEMGQVMKALMPKLSGRADGKVVSQLVQKKLAGS